MSEHARRKALYSRALSYLVCKGDRDAYFLSHSSFYNAFLRALVDDVPIKSIHNNTLAGFDVDIHGLAERVQVEAVRIRMTT